MITYMLSKACVVYPECTYTHTHGPTMNWLYMPRIMTESAHTHVPTCPLAHPVTPLLHSACLLGEELHSLSREMELCRTSVAQLIRQRDR